MKLSLAKTETEIIKENFLFWLDQATQEEFEHGQTWYPEVGQECEAIASRFDGISKLQVAKIVSILSPQKKWEDNLAEAVGCLETYFSVGKVEKPQYHNGEKYKNVFATGKQIEKVWAVIENDTEDGFGNKTHSFAMNIANAPYSDHVTNDFWMSRAALTTEKIDNALLPPGPSGKQYNRMSEIITEIANERGLKGYEVQAIVWVTIRNRWQ